MKPDATTAESHPSPAALRRQAMLHGPILPTIVRLALPTVGVMVAQVLVGVLEAFYLGFLGTDALVGVALVFPLWMLLTMTSGAGIGSGVGSAVARALGAGRVEDARALVRHALVLAVSCGLGFTAWSFLFGGAFYHALGGRGADLAAATLYSNWVMAAAVPVWIVNLLSAALRGAGNVRVPALVVFAGAIVLIPLSPLLIFGLGPIPGFGIAGAGMAIAAYYGTAALILLRYMRTGGSGLGLASGRLEARLFRDILGVGILATVSAIQVNATVLLVTGIVGRFGADALAGYGLASRLDYLMTPLVAGIGTAVLPMIGMNLGAGQVARARRIGWTGIAAAALLTETVGLAVACFPAAWIGLFTRDPAVLGEGVAYLRIVGLVYGALGINVVTNMAAQGGGRPLWPLLAGTTRLLVSAGLGWVAVVHFAAGPTTLFAIVAAGAALSAAICLAAQALGATIRTGKE